MGEYAEEWEEDESTNQQFLWERILKNLVEESGGADDGGDSEDIIN